MGKIIAAFTTVSLSALAIGTRVAPNAPAFWLASGNTVYMGVRIALAVVIFGQLITKPPRKTWFRVLAGLLAIGVGTWTVMQTYNYTMMATDTVLFMLASVSIGLTALELTPQELLQSKTRPATA